MRPGVGVYVAKLSMKQLRDVDHVRRLLEVSALKLAIPTLQPNEIENAEGCLRDMRRLAERRDWEAYWQAHLAFHTILFAASGNLVLTEILLSLLRTTTRYSRICLEASPPLWLYDEQNHERIMQAIKQADLDGIQRIVGEMNDWLLAQFQTATENPAGDLAPYFA
jgi:DNA-binding GntR family transcriptional regulator